MTNSVSKTIANIRNRLDSAEKSLVRKAFLQNEITISSSTIELQNGPIIIEEENMSDTIGFDKYFQGGTLDNSSIALDKGNSYSLDTYKVLNPDNLYRNYMSLTETQKLIDTDTSTATTYPLSTPSVSTQGLRLLYDFADVTVSELVVDEVIRDQTSWDNDGTLNGFTANDGICNGGVTISDGAMSFDGVNDYVDLGVFTRFIIYISVSLPLCLSTNQNSRRVR